MMFFCFSGQVIPSAGSGVESTADKSSDSSSPELVRSVLVVSGGEGYIDFRMGESDASRCRGPVWNTGSLTHSSLPIAGDEGGDTENIDEPTLNLQPFLAKAERSHLIVWQVMSGEEWPLFHSLLLYLRPFQHWLIEFLSCKSQLSTKNEVFIRFVLSLSFPKTFPHHLWQYNADKMENNGRLSPCFFWARAQCTTSCLEELLCLFSLKCFLNP